MTIEAAIAAAVRGELEPLRAELAAIREQLERRDAPAELLDVPALARLCGCSPRALRQRLRRGSELASIALKVDGRRRWRRGDIDALLARARAPRLRVAGGS
jgi:hypothetical protein